MTTNRNKVGRYTSAPTATVRERFERQFSFVPEAGCWIWTGSNKNQFGHGAFKMGIRSSPVLFAHRVSWALYIGPIPAGMHVLHRCDNPACVNPHHLFLGTAQDNADDMVKKGRQRKGSKCAHAKIDEIAAAAIKRMAGKSTSAIASMFGLSRQSVADIIYGRTWKHV